MNPMLRKLAFCIFVFVGAVCIAYQHWNALLVMFLLPVLGVVVPPVLLVAVTPICIVCGVLAFSINHAYNKLGAFIMRVMPPLMFLGSIAGVANLSVP